MSDMSAFVTGKIVLSGDSSPWDHLEDIWNEAKEKIKQRKIQMQTNGGGGGMALQVGPDEDDDDEDGMDEEAKIIATFKPEVEPLDPRTREFWKRHFGTDMLVAHGTANLFGAVMFALASVYFIKLSYPEITMIMAYRAMTKDPNSMTFMERYFTANEMLIALWMVTGAFVIPIFFVVIYEATVLHEMKHALIDFLSIFVAFPLSGVLNLSVHPRARGT
eukprot:scaffold1990_cov182-Chaetoceros_neogracile.AAC.1